MNDKEIKNNGTEESGSGISERRIRRLQRRARRRAARRKDGEKGGTLTRRILRSLPDAQGPRSTKIGFDFDYFAGALTRIVSAVLSVVLVVYFGYHLVSIFTESVSTAGVYRITQTETAEGTGWFIRDDKPLGSRSEGYPYPVLADGSRAGKGEALCRYYAEDKTRVREEIAATDAEIALLTAAVGANVVSPGLKQSFTEAAETYSSFMKSLSLGDYGAAYDTGLSLRGKFARRLFLSGEGGGLSSELQSLRDKRSSLLSSLGTPLKTITAPHSGYWFSGSDGLESAFGSDLAATFSEESFNAAKNATPGEISKSGVFCSSSDWYMAVEFEGDAAGALTPGEEYPLTVTDSGLVIVMKLESRIKTESGMLLLFSSGVYPTGFGWPRHCRISVPVKEYSGYRVPLSAMSSYEGMTGVYTLNGGYVFFRRTEVLTEGTGYYLVAAYEDVEEGPPATYEVLRRGGRSVADGYVFVTSFADQYGLERQNSKRPPSDPDSSRGLYEILTLHGDSRGIPVEYGKKYPYYYHLSALEDIIVSGGDLYHGKVLD